LVDPDGSAAGRLALRPEVYPLARDQLFHCDQLVDEFQSDVQGFRFPAIATCANRRAALPRAEGFIDRNW
jgi:hypothetical protein